MAVKIFLLPHAQIGFSECAREGWEDECTEAIFSGDDEGLKQGGGS